MGISQGPEELLQDPCEGDTESETTLARVPSVNRHNPRRILILPTGLLPTISLV